MKLISRKLTLKSIFCKLMFFSFFFYLTNLTENDYEIDFFFKIDIELDLQQVKIVYDLRSSNQSNFWVNWVVNCFK